MRGPATGDPALGNTKQLFVSLAAEYETKINRVNQVSIWDRVVENKVSAFLHNVPVETQKESARPECNASNSMVIQ